MLLMNNSTLSPYFCWHILEYAGAYGKISVAYTPLFTDWGISNDKMNAIKYSSVILFKSVFSVCFFFFGVNFLCISKKQEKKWKKTLEKIKK